MNASHTLAASLFLALAACSAAQPSASETRDSAEDGSSETRADPSASASSESTGEDSTIFVPEGPDIPEDCDVFAQDCGEGQKCVPWIGESGLWVGFLCVPVLGEQGVGEPCELNFGDSTDNCDAGSNCFSFSIFSEEPEGTCHAFCTGSADDPGCESGHECLIGNGYPGPVLCIRNCDPIEQDCDEDQGCYWASPRFMCMQSSENLGPGEACGYIDDCAPGHVCADNLPAGCEGPCCTPYCDVVQDDSPCAALPGTSCVLFFEEGQALPGYEDLGMCV